jgi:iron complex outermembrane receptor protein
MIRSKHATLVSSLIAAVLAQTAARAADQAAAAPAPAAAKKSATDTKADEAAKPAELEQVTVTGSRIKRTDFTSPSPVLIIGSEDTTLEGMLTTTQILQTNTLTAGSQQINDQTTGFVTENGPGRQHRRAARHRFLAHARAAQRSPSVARRLARAARCGRP